MKRKYSVLDNDCIVNIETVILHVSTIYYIIATKIISLTFYLFCNSPT